MDTPEKIASFKLPFSFSFQYNFDAFQDEQLR